MKKALLVVSFGTSYHDTREKNIAACERDLAASCPDRTLFRAFTSGMIIRKLQQRDGIHIDTPLQALQKLAEQGYQDVAIQSLHIINGDEYEKIVREVQSMRPRFQRLTLGAPLFERSWRLCAADAGPAPADAAAGGDGASGVYGARRQPPRLRGLRLSGSYDGGAGFSGAGGGGGKLSRSGHRH